MIINANTIIPEFKEADMGAILNANPLGDLQYRKFFPTAFNTGLTFGNLEGETGAKVMADVVALDSNVPLKGREFIEKIKGEIPKIEVGRAKNERDFFRINELRNAVALYPNNASVKNQLINAIYDDGLFVVNAINARLEHISKSLLSKGVYTTNSGVKLDFKVKSKNASIDWFNVANASTFDPIKDLRDAQAEALKSGYRYTTAVMDLATFHQFVKSEKVIKFSASFAQNAFGLAQEPTLAQLNNALASQNLPTITIWESYVNEEGKDGTLTAMSGWELGNIHLATSDDFGNTQYTISPEATIDLNETSKSTVSDFILVSVLGEANPMRVLTKGTAFATPVLNNVKQKLILKTKLS